MDDVKIFFSLIDYILFAAMLLCSVLIGLYFGFCGKKQTPEEYLLGGKSMKVFPVGLSLIATHVSGLTLLGVPSDVYFYGANYVWICLTLVLICILTCYVYLPVLIKLKVPSVFEYLKLRFGKHSRMFASFLFMLQVFVYIPIVAFIPAIALAQASGIYVHYITPVIGLICVFYTTIGGFKAVVWTDALQFIGIVGSVAVVFCLGIISVGGFDIIWQRALEGQRLDIFDYTLDPTVRDGIWPILMGGTIHWLANVCFLPGSVQKYLSVSKLCNARKVAYMLCGGLIVLKAFSVMTGIIVYAKYYYCDPISSGAVTRRDQILPYFVMDVAGNIPGLPGVFIAGIFSAALSNVSGVGLLAIPADIYMYGAHIFWICLSFPILCALSCYIYLPVFFKLKPNSIYEYFNHRFDNKVKRFASFLYIASVFVYSPVVIFVPALAFSQVTDINVRFITPIICAICICYTALGGLKAVIWTNALNFVVMLVSVLVILILGISFVGGIATVWQRALLGHRLDIFDFRFDPTVRDSFWSLFIGSIFHFICLAILNQGAMQKFLAVPTPTQAKKIYNHNFIDNLHWCYRICKILEL